MKHQKPSDKARTTEPKVAAVPTAYIFKRGRVGRLASQLSRDVREIFRPNTSTRLKERKSNKMRDFINVCGPLGVTHLGIFTPSTLGTNFRIIRAPQGPTAHFRMEEYSLMRDLRRIQAAPRAGEEDYLYPPLVLLDGFGDAPHLRLLSTLFRFMFPAIDPATTPLHKVRRAVLFAHDASTGLIQVRHYGISLKDAPDAATAPIAALLASKTLDLGGFESLAEYVTAAQSAAEAAGAKKKTLSLQELGPRMSMRCIRIEDGVDCGAVLYHAIESKTEAEVAANAAHAKGRAARDRESKQAARLAFARKRGHLAREAAANATRDGRQVAAAKRLGIELEGDGKINIRKEDLPQAGDSAEMYRAPTRREKKRDRQDEREDRRNARGGRGGSSRGGSRGGAGARGSFKSTGRDHKAQAPRGKK